MEQISNKKASVRSLYLKAVFLIFVPIIVLLVAPIRGFGYFILAVVGLICVIVGIVMGAIGLIRSIKKAV